MGAWAGSGTVGESGLVIFGGFFLWEPVIKAKRRPPVNPETAGLDFRDVALVLLDRADTHRLRADRAYPVHGGPRRGDRRHDAHVVGVDGRPDQVLVPPRDQAPRRVDHELDLAVLDHVD